jgi:hypothetical protein
MAHAIAEAKGAMAPGEAGARKPLDVAALLDELEHLIDAMIEVAGGGAAAEPAPTDAQSPAETGEVPTVSGVVLGLGSAHETLDPSAIADIPHPTDIGVGGGPTVAMLKAMVEALNASVPARAPDAPATETEATTAEATAAAAPPPEAAAPAVEVPSASESIATEAAVAELASPAGAASAAAEMLEPAPQPVEPEQAAAATEEEFAVAQPAEGNEPQTAQPEPAAAAVRVVEAMAPAFAPPAAEAARVPPAQESAAPLAGRQPVDFPASDAPAPAPGSPPAGSAQEAFPAAVAPEPVSVEATAVAAITLEAATTSPDETIAGPSPAAPEAPSYDVALELEAAAEATSEPPPEPLQIEHPPVASKVETSGPAPEAPATAAALPGDVVVINEVELLARLGELEARPFPPTEVGTAMIFTQGVSGRPSGRGSCCAKTSGRQPRADR